MGLTLHINLFRDVDHEAVLQSYLRFHVARGFEVIDEHQRSYAYQLFQRDNAWVLLELAVGWKWGLWRAAQSYVSRELGCAGMLVFVCDGDYWGYEFFNNGDVLDHFVQVNETAFGNEPHFPDKDCRGNPDLLTRLIPNITVEDLAGYLVRNPVWEGDYPEDDRWERHRQLNVPVRVGDEFPRFHECAAVDFLRYIGVSTELREGYVTWLSALHHSFRLVESRDRQCSTE